jgi:mannan endo-1,4-beta-mannosidase
MKHKHFIDKYRSVDTIKSYLLILELLNLQIIITLLLMAAFFTSSAQQNKRTPAPEGFVTVDGTQFKINGKPYQFIGTNFWYGMHLGVTKHKGRLLKELDQLKALGCNNLRIMVGSEGPEEEKYRVQPPLMIKPGEYNDDILKGLDFLLVEMKKRDLYGVLVLGNFWHWSGGFSQYVSWAKDKPIPYPSLNGGISWAFFMDYTFRFYRNTRAKKWFKDHVKKIIERTNSISGEAYTKDPTIMSWQLANEPKCGIRVKAYRGWIRQTAKFIRKMDPHHLISTGSEGIMSESLLGNRRKNFIKNHTIGIDYLTVHVWIQNWGWYNPHKIKSLDSAKKKAIVYLDKHISIAEEMQLPLVLEEFGIARDQESYNPSSPIKCRDSYYELMFEHLEKNIAQNGPFQGINFWAWAGIGRPATEKSVYAPGDDLIGDPPHEYQGWYSVYDTDTSTLELIKTFNAKFQD